MKTGAGFLQLNTPKEINFTDGLVVTARDLAAKKPQSRASIVKLPSYMHHVRQGFQEACRRLNLKALVEDEEDTIELPPVAKFRSPAAQASQSSIDIVVTHLESGSCVFKLNDFDGVLAEGDVPQIVKDEEDVSAERAMQAHVVYPWTMSDDERQAYDKLFALWKAKSLSNSAQGQAHRQESERLLPDMSVAAPQRKRGRADPDATDAAGAAGPSGVLNEAEVEAFDDIDFAIRLAESVLR